MSSSKKPEFREIAHCGGQVTFHIATAQDGRHTIQFGIRYAGGAAAAWFAIYALPQGIPVGMIELGGIGQPWNPPPFAECIPVFIASDREGKFGHRCPQCRGYWRSDAVPTRWEMTCPYCGLRASTHNFLTLGQRNYVEEYCRRALDAYRAPDGEYIIDMDEVADAAGKDGPKPKFYYAEESQQNSFNCKSCGSFNDILGRYGYCSSCGTFNGLAELEKAIAKVQERVASGQEFENCVRDSVASFDSFARQISKQLAHRVPMTQQRKNKWKSRLFHGLTSAVSDLQSVFDIDLTKGISGEDVAFATLMFHRRHIYEHNGGEVDDKYIANSGDTSVRPKQLLYESRDSAQKIVTLVLQLGRNFSDGFHSIFKPEQVPIRIRTR